MPDTTTHIMAVLDMHFVLLSVPMSKSIINSDSIRIIIAIRIITVRGASGA